MNRIQFWILNVTCLFVGILLLGEVPLMLQVRSANRELRGMGLLVRQGQESRDLWQKVAYRAYQLGVKDPALAEVLQHQQINITPSPQPETAAPVVPSPKPASHP
jgi:hypothetical protein